jgi:hypothetical protein
VGYNTRIKDLRMSTLRLLPLAVLSFGLTACITFRDDGKGTYTLGVAPPAAQHPEDTHPEDTHPEDTHPEDTHPEDTQASLQAETPNTPQGEMPTQAFEPVVQVPKTHPPEAPNAIGMEDENNPHIANATFANVKVALVAHETDGPQLVFQTLHTVEKINLTFESQASCDQRRATGTVIQPGLFALAYDCFQEGGDNNYTTEYVVILQYDGAPTSRTDFNIRWTGEGSRSASGYYADENTQVTFEVEGKDVIAIETTRSGCEAGVNYDEDSDTPCTPTAETTRTVLFPL